MASFSPPLLPDDELRRKLRDLGVEVGPIIPTTRAVYERKLVELEATAKKKSSSSGSSPLSMFLKPNSPAPKGRNLINFSSDECESDSNNERGDKAPPSSTRKLRRRRSTPPTTPTNGGLLFGKTPPSKGNNRNAINSSHYHQQHRTSYVSGHARFNNNAAAINGSGTSNEMPSYFDTEGSDTDVADDGARSVVKGGKSKGGTPKASDGYSKRNHVSSSPRTRSKTSESSSSSATSKSLGVPISTKYHSSSSSSSATTPLSVQTSYDIGGGGNNNNATGCWLRKAKFDKSPTTVPNGSADLLLTTQFRTMEDLDVTPSSNSHFISMVLVAVVVLFFVVLGLLYLGVRSKDSKSLQPKFQEVSGGRIQVNSCKLESEMGSCNKYRDEGKMLAVINDLRSELRKKAGEYECTLEEARSERKMSLKAVNSWLKPEDREDLYAYIGLFLQHPEWGIRLYDQKFEPLPMNINSKPDVSWLESVSADKPFLCRFQQAFSVVLYKILLIVAVLLTLFVVGVLVYWRWKRYREYQRTVYSMTEHVVDILQRHYEACQSNPELPPYLAIPHIRDMLIPLSERKQKLPIWESVVKFLQDNESRVRVECQIVQGEEFQVWRWLQQPSPQGKNAKIKVWQGQAFENLDTGLNALPYSPTPCLKIRNMFDPEVEYGDNWHVHIQDAILEKCEGSNCIIHLKVDTSSTEGLVFVKCTSAEAAGTVFKSLHGWWFDGNLVTVRFLRLERYHERFPEAVNCHTPLEPSNNKRLSLVAPAASTGLEH